MTATLLQIYNVRFEASDIRKRVIAAIGLAAIDIINENAGTANHAARLAWAKKALADARPMAEKLLWYIALNATIGELGESATDNDIKYVVNSALELVIGAS